MKRLIDWFNEDPLSSSVLLGAIAVVVFLIFTMSHLVSVAHEHSKACQAADGVFIRGHCYDKSIFIQYGEGGDIFD